MQKKTILIALFALLVVFVFNVSSVFATNEVSTEIAYSTVGDSINQFTYSGSGLGGTHWDAGQAGSHTWTKQQINQQNADQFFYKVKFFGHKIEIFAEKNHPMGKVKYKIDEGEWVEKDLYNKTRQLGVKIHTFDNLTEGEHTLTAQAVGVKSDRNNVATKTAISAGKVVVYKNAQSATSIAFNEESYALEIGEQKAFTIQVQPNDAVVSDLAYTSLDSEVATVEGDKIVAKKAGTTTITATSAATGLTASAQVTVTNPSVFLGGSIVDYDYQYTNDKLEEVTGLSTKQATLSAWKNDKALSLIALYTKGSAISNVVVSASDLTDGSGHTISSSAVKGHFIKSTKAYVGSFLGYGSRNRAIPAPTDTNRKDSSDIVFTDTSLPTIDAHKVQPVMLMVDVPKDAHEGTYTTTVTISADGVEPLTFDYTVKVAPIALHDVSEYKNYFDLELWQYPYRTAEYYNVTPFSNEHFEILKPMLALYKSVGGDAITATMSEDAWEGQTYSARPQNNIHYPSMIKWTKSNGSMSYDYTEFDKWVTFAKEQGLGNKVVIYSMAPWSQSFTYWENGTLRNERFNNTNYVPMWTHFVTDLVRHLDEKGWTDSVYMGFDERHFDTRAFEIVKTIKSQSGKSLKTTGAMDAFKNKMAIAKEITDLTVGDYAAQNDLQLFNELVEARNAKGLKTTLYSCTEHQPGNFSLSAPVESYWSVVNAGKQTSGFLRWAYDAWVADPLNDVTHNAFEPGDPFIVFPGDVQNGNKVRSSVRLERIAEAVRDMNKIKFMVAQAPVLQADVDAMYAKIRTIARKDRNNYMPADKVNQLSNEMKVFKQDLDALTVKYLEVTANGTREIELVTVQNKTVSVGEIFTLDYVVLPENALNKNVTFTSGNTRKLIVDSKGRFTALAKGTVEVTVASKADPTKTATATVTIKAPTVSTEGQVAYYSFNNQNGNDSWGTRHGQASSLGVTYVDSEYGKAAKLTADGHFVLPTNDVLDRESSWTVSFHFKADNLPENRSLMMSTSNMNQGLALRLDPGATRNYPGYRVGTNGGDVLTFRTRFTPGQWYHVVLTQDRTRGLTFFVNGVLAENTNAWSSRSQNTLLAPIELIGKSFEGTIDEVKIYSRVLSNAEIKVLDLKEGIQFPDDVITLFTGQTHDLEADVNSSEDLALSYASSNEQVASVDNQGVVTAHKVGSATITLTAGNYTKTVAVHVEKQQLPKPQVPRYILDESLTKIVDERPEETETTGRYLGQPDMVQTKTGRLIIAYPKGHGKGPVIMQVSDDNGENWRILENTPASWEGSQETPTLYKLNLANGTERLLMINSNPGWGRDSAGIQYGWNTSYSDDNGQTWTEYKNWHPQIAPGKNNDAIVAMASLVQLKDAEGNFIQKWMGVYHTNEFINYKTFLTFDEEGNEQWTKPVPYLGEHRDIEASHKICEVGMFRSPDGNRIVALARSQSHNHLATLFYSDDEGQTWSRPVHLPASLAGERHKVVVDPISKRLMVVFREIQYDINNNGRMENNDWRAGEWLAWVGSYDQLMNLESGDYNIEIAKDYAPSPKSGDTGYTGIVALNDGTLVMVSYGHWHEEESNKWVNVNKGVFKDLVSIKQAKFKLGQVEQANNLVNKIALQEKLVEAKAIGADQYTEESFAKLQDTINSAQAIVDGNSHQQVEVDAMVTKLQEAIGGLVQKQVEPETPVDPEIDPTDPADTEEPELPIYEIIEGENLKVVKGSVSPARFRSNGAFAQFDHVKVDGSKLDAVHYTVREGSTIVELSNGFVNTLSEGAHTLDIVFNDGGKATTNFTVAPAEVVAPVEPTPEDPAPDAGTNPGDNENPGNPTQPEQPQDPAPVDPSEPELTPGDGSESNPADNTNINGDKTDNMGDSAQVDGNSAQNASNDELAKGNAQIGAVKQIADTSEPLLGVAGFAVLGAMSLISSRVFGLRKES